MIIYSNVTICFSRQISYWHEYLWNWVDGFCTISIALKMPKTAEKESAFLVSP